MKLSGPDAYGLFFSSENVWSWLNLIFFVKEDWNELKLKEIGIFFFIWWVEVDISLLKWIEINQSWNFFELKLSEVGIKIYQWKEQSLNKYIVAR